MRQPSSSAQPSFRTAWGLGVVALLVLAIPPESQASDGDRPSLRVLFIGNSYTRYNDLPQMVESLSTTAREGPVLETRQVTRGGFDLRRHWRRTRARARIRSGGFDAVVIQGHSLGAIHHPDRLAHYARRFSDRVRAAGARLVLFQTWPSHPRHRIYDRRDWEGPRDMHAQIDSVYHEVARELEATVSPVGRAWMRALREAPSLRLHRRDGAHPGVAGTYLSACVLYGTLSGLDPRTARWRPLGMPEEQARRIRAIATASLGAPSTSRR